MTYKKKALGRIVCLLLLSLFLGLTFGVSLRAYTNPGYEAGQQSRIIKRVIVNQGDTLWGLIEENYSYSGDIRKAIYEVQKINNLQTAIINPGEVLYIPLE
ncbi:MAG: hypothetical protein FWF85_03115 [Clostridiales bacterium]|jgi:hypothetical protein|nr:hypothetical protein [Clostridiales bacterium]MDR2713638.1 hypothetical protein [Clostridiales bacterium]